MIDHLIFIANIAAGVFVGGCFLWTILPKRKPLLVMVRLYSECPLSQDEKRGQMIPRDTEYGTYSKTCPFNIPPFIGMGFSPFELTFTPAEVTAVSCGDKGDITIYCKIKHRELHDFKCFSSSLYRDGWIGARDYSIDE